MALPSVLPPGSGVRGQVLAEDVEAGSCSYKVGTKTSVERGKKSLSAFQSA